jgi:hypothetical protein
MLFAPVGGGWREVCTYEEFHQKKTATILEVEEVF